MLTDRSEDGQENLPILQNYKTAIVVNKGPHKPHAYS